MKGDIYSTAQRASLENTLLYCDPGIRKSLGLKSRGMGKAAKAAAKLASPTKPPASNAASEAEKRGFNRDAVGDRLIVVMPK